MNLAFSSFQVENVVCILALCYLTWIRVSNESNNKIKLEGTTKSVNGQDKF